uniref:SJCHGC04945 protein n=1 Tax=Schistosoma japonicum TaxID=6182 RepID=Q5DEY8_SCHJA|nr:SJCHGC04945 protein [Schistosoma japonicum]
MAIYLRIKRSNTDCPSKICETQNLIKRPKADLPVQFKYIGSQTNSDSSLTDKINEVYTSDKLCKIICNTSDAIVVDENHSVKCQDLSIMFTYKERVFFSDKSKQFKTSCSYIWSF